MKYLVVIAVLAVAWFVWRKGRERDASQTPPAPPAATGRNAPGTPVAMVTCAHCGIHLPVHDALPAPGAGGSTLHFCSREHRDADARRQS